MSNIKVQNKSKIRKQKDLVNQYIPVQELLVIDEKGENLGVISKAKALAIAEERELDLVVVSPDANPMVAKIMNFAKHKYDQQKKAKELKKKQNTVVVKEIRLSPVIEKHDLETKFRQASRFIGEGNKVKITIRFFGRMITRQDNGRQIMQKFIDDFGNKIVVEQEPKMENRNLFAVIAPNKNYKKEEE